MLTVNWNCYHYYQIISNGPGGAGVRRRGAPVPWHNGTMASPSLEVTSYPCFTLWLTCWLLQRYGHGSSHCNSTHLCQPNPTQPNPTHGWIQPTSMSELVPSLLGRCKQKQRGLRGLLCRWPSITEWGTSLLRDPVSEMTYTVSSVTLNPSIPYYPQSVQHSQDVLTVNK